MNTALIIIDIQNDYFENGANPLPGAEKAAANAARLLERFRDEAKPIVYVQHLSVRPGSTFFVPGTFGVEVHESIRPLGAEKFVMKHYPNSFRGTDLQEFLKEQEVRNLVLCGMMTHMCVDSTVRAAKDLGYDCTLVGDACATRDLSVMDASVKAEDVQTSFLGALSYFYATVVATDAFLA